MNIQEATILSTKYLVTMTREEWKQSHKAEVLPTNDSFLQCLIIGNNGEEIINYWQPSADDLKADDWEVITPVINQG